MRSCANISKISRHGFASQAAKSGFKTLNDIPGPTLKEITVDYPKLGNFVFFQNLWDAHGDVVKVKVPLKDPIICLYKPEHCEDFLRRAAPRPVRPGFLGMKIKRQYDNDRGRGFKVHGLLHTQDDEWRNFRTKVQQPMLRPNATVRYTTLLESVAEEFIDLKIRDKRDPVSGQVQEDFIKDMYKWALESVGLLALNTRLGCLHHSVDLGSAQEQLIQSIQNIFEYSDKLEGGSSFWQYFPWLHLQLDTDFKRFYDAHEIFERISHEYIKEALDKLAKKGPAENDEERPLLQLLAERGCDLETATVMAMDMILAGVDTSSHTVGFILYHLAKHPEVQESLHREIKEHLPRKDSKLGLKSLGKMKYLAAVLKEGLRMYPPAVVTARAIEPPFRFGDYEIEKKCVYLGMHLYMCRSARYFENPEQFRPERWIRNHSGKENVHPFAMLPFGHGPRMCVGRRFAEQESKILLCKLLQNFKVEWHHEDVGFVIKTIMIPGNPLKFTFVDR